MNLTARETVVLFDAKTSTPAGLIKNSVILVFDLIG